MQNTEIHSAGFIVIDSQTILENGYITVEMGHIKEVGRKPPAGPVTDHGPGILMPALVNPHLHLELSALKGAVPFDRGFRPWVAELLKKREEKTADELVAEGKKEALNLFQTGHHYIGDISTLLIGRKVVEHTGLKGICFNEYLGATIDPQSKVESNHSISISNAGHAPHTTSPDVLTQLKKQTQNAGLPFSIHVAESDDEIKFVRDKKGDWADFLTRRGIDWQSWDVGQKTPVAYLAAKGLLGPDTLAVHLLQTDDKDIKIIAETQTCVCLCPRSNWNLHRRLPDIERLYKFGIKPALGTDSLASCSSLQIWDEMTFVRQHYPNIDARDIFDMATINGARALGLDPLAGSLHPGKQAAFIYKDIITLSPKNLIERIICNDQ